MEELKPSRSLGPVASPALVMYPRPFGTDDRIDSFAAFLPGETLGAYVRRAQIAVPSRVVRVEHNGRPVPLALWAGLRPRQGDIVVISARALGGGGGNKVLRAVAMVALVVISYGYGAALGGALGFSGATASAVGSGLIMAAGSLAINALIPMPTPTAVKLGNGQKYESSPTYSISGGRNRTRPWEPMLLVFGRHKVVPDLGATPYSVYSGDDQFFNQIFHFGLQGNTLQITEPRIGETLIENYQDVHQQRSEEDGKLSMFPGNVDTIQGFNLLQTEGWNARQTATGVYTLVVNLAARLFRVEDDGSLAVRSVVVRIQYRKVGDTEWTERSMMSPVYATHYWSLVDRATGQQIRFGSTVGNDHEEGDRVTYDPVLAVESFGMAGVAEWRWVPHPNVRGLPWVGIAPDPLVSAGGPGLKLSGSAQAVARATVSWVVEPGAYEVRVMKVSPDINDSREANEVAVAQILAYQQDLADYTGQARLGISIKATGQLNGAVDEFNAIAQGLYPLFENGEWVTKATSNPAWLFLWFARGKKDADGNRVYGAGYPDSQIDIEGIKAFAAWCDHKKLTFDYVLDARMSSDQVLQMVARAGRGAKTHQKGKLGVIWDAEDLPITNVFGPMNVKAGSFNITYLNDGTVDEIIANFVNRETWQMEEVRAKVPGATNTNNPLQLDLDGFTDRDAAGREANLLAAAQVFKRRRIAWESDIEGIRTVRGDVVSFSHDLTVWGYSGRLMPGSAGPLMKLQHTVVSDGAGVALIRDPEGNMVTVDVISAIGEVDELTIISDLDGFRMPGDPELADCAPYDWAWQFDPVATPGRRFKVTSVKPSGEAFQFEAVDDDPEYYRCEDNDYEYTPPRDGGLLAGVVFGITATESILSVTADQIGVRFAWTVTSDAACLVSLSVNGVAQEPRLLSAREFTYTARTGDVLELTITPRRIGTAGQPVRFTHTVRGLASPLPAVQGLQSIYRDGLTWLTWQRAVDLRQPGYEIRLGSSWADSQTIATTVATEQVTVSNGLYWVAARFALASGQVVYGPPASILIAGAVLERNVILSRSEAPEWDGALAGGALVLDGQLTLAAQGDWFASPDLYAEPDLLWIGGAAPSGTFTVAEASRVDVGYVAPVRLDAQIDFTAISQEDDLFAVADWFAMSDMLNGSARSAITAKAQIRWAQEEGEWSEWADLVPGLVNARFFDVRLYLATSDTTIIPTVTRFEWSVDVPDLIQHGEALTVPAAGLRVNFPKVFHARPNLQVTVLDAQDGDRPVVPESTSDASGFDVTIFNGATPVARQINWIAQGY